MNATAPQFKTLDEAKDAAKNGKTVHWQNTGYTVKPCKFEEGHFNVVCFNGHCAYLSNDYKAEDFFTA